MFYTINIPIKAVGGCDNSCSENHKHTVRAVTRTHFLYVIHNLFIYLTCGGEHYIAHNYNV